MLLIFSVITSSDGDATAPDEDEVVATADVDDNGPAAVDDDGPADVDDDGPAAVDDGPAIAAAGSIIFGNWKTENKFQK